MARNARDILVYLTNWAAREMRRMERDKPEERTQDTSNYSCENRKYHGEEIRIERFGCNRVNFEELLRMYIPGLEPKLDEYPVYGRRKCVL